MSQASLIRKLHTLTPATDYAKLLREEFDMEVPASALGYQKEYLYKYLLKSKYEGAIFDPTAAKASVEKLVSKYPHVLVKHGVTGAKPAAKRGERKSFRGLHDGYYIVFSANRGKYLAFDNTKPLFAKDTLESAKAAVIKKFGSVDIKVID